MNKALILTIAIGGLLTSAVPAQAQTLAEVHQKMTEAFAKSDSNKDGKLTQKEAKDGGMWRINMGFSQIDKQKRGYLTLPQIKAIAAKRFE
jgi:hypothetical protein